MTVYVITEGSYSEYHIVAVSLDKDKADKLAKTYDADVEEWETDTARDRRAIEGYHLFRVWFTAKGEVNSVGDYSDCEWVEEGIGETQLWPCCCKAAKEITVTVWARNKEEAIKIASEKRAQWLAENAGIT